MGAHTDEEMSKMGKGGTGKGKNKGAQALFDKLKKQGYKMMGGAAHSPNAEELAKLKVAEMGTERRNMPMSDNMMEAMKMAKKGLESYPGGGSYGRRMNKMK